MPATERSGIDDAGPRYLVGLPNAVLKTEDLGVEATDHARERQVAARILYVRQPGIADLGTGSQLRVLESCREFSRFLVNVCGTVSNSIS